METVTTHNATGPGWQSIGATIRLKCTDNMHIFSFVGDNTEVAVGAPCDCGKANWKKPPDKCDKCGHDLKDQ